MSDIFAGYPDVAPFIYGFNLDVINGDVRLQGADEKIGNTVVSVVEKFLFQNTAAVVYLCDTTDNRQIFRKRKFDSWFKKFDQGKVRKFDSEVQIENTLILNTLLISKSNPLTDRLVAVFISLNKNLKEKTTES